MMKKRTLKKAAVGILISLVGIVALHLVGSIVIYEAIFSTRFETPDWMPEASDYEGLSCERSDFLTEDGTRLAGYKYSCGESSPLGVIVVAHGFGNGHRPYLPFIAAFASRGYLVFAYDGTGSDESSGDGTEGIVRALIDLEYAMKHVQKEPDYEGLSVALFGHSMGAYAAGSALALFSEIRAAVLVAPFNESEEMLLHESKKRVGAVARLALPTVAYYEWLKFGGAYADISVSKSIMSSDAGVLIIAAEDDATVPTECGLDILETELSGIPRVKFSRLSSGGHTDLMYSARARAYRREILLGWQSSGVIDYGEYLEKTVDKSLYFEVDEALVSAALSLFAEYA